MIIIENWGETHKWHKDNHLEIIVITIWYFFHYFASLGGSKCPSFSFCYFH